MKKMLFLSGLISLFSLAEPVQHQLQQKPLARIIEEDDLKNNSFLNKALRIIFETELENEYSVKIRGQKLPEENVQSQKHCFHCMQPLVEKGKVKLEITGIEDYLQEGPNSIEITAVNNKNKRNKTTKTVNVEIGSATKKIKGIEFEMCKRAEQNYMYEKEEYEKIADEVNRLNKLFPKAELKKITMQYEQVCACNCSSLGIKKGGSTNAAYDFERIIIGYGNIAQYKYTNQGANLMQHEYAHGIFINATEKFNEEFDDLHKEIKANNHELFELFTESNYLQDKEFGHPQENATELFASAFTIKTSFNEEFQRRLKKYTPDEQELANRVIELIEKGSKMSK